jgi:hypothetical protein
MDECRQTIPEYIAGMQAFLEVAKANKNPKGFMCCPCSLCRNDKDYSDWGTLHLHLIKNGFMANYVFGPGTVKDVTTPLEIIPYYHLNHSIWSLSDNKESSC